MQRIKTKSIKKGYLSIQVSSGIFSSFSFIFIKKISKNIALIVIFYRLLFFCLHLPLPVQQRVINRIY